MEQLYALRPSWDNYFCNLAMSVAQRGTCPRAQVGCVLVRDNRILATGFNGSATGMEHCTDVGCIIENNHCTRAIHAEMNAIIQCALHGVSSWRSTCYCTHFPCVACAKVLINAGVWRVVYISDYANGRGDQFFKWAKIQIEQMG